MEPRQLVLLRHAKSSWDDPTIDDHERPLNERGRRAALRIGDLLRDRGIAPALVLCSSARRTRQTLELLGLDPNARVLVDRELYGANADDLLARIRQIGPQVTSVLLIAHNPGVQELAISLAGDHERLASFPTAAVADLRVPVVSWDDLSAGMATLWSFVTPRELD